MTRTRDSVSLIRDLVAFPTVSRDSNKDLLAYVESYLGRHGVPCEILWNEDRTKGNLWAVIGPRDKPGVILSGHSDVVPVEDQPWSSDPFRLREEGGLLYGRGACDMKGFVGIVLAFVPDLVRRDLKRPVHLAISYDEELGCTGVWSMAERIAGLPVRPALCIVGEPTSMGIVVGHKGGSCHRVVVNGLAAHSSLAPRGVNAVEHSAEMIGTIASISAEIATGPRDLLYDIPHSTLSVTTVSGGTAFNIIPERCEFVFDMRALPGLDTAEVVARIADYANGTVLPRMRERSPHASITIEKVVEYPALEIAPEHPAVTFVSNLLKRNDFSKVAYGTEAGVFSKYGIPSVVCGPGSIEQAHKADEYLALSQVEKCEAFLERLVSVLETDEFPW